MDAWKSAGSVAAKCFMVGVGRKDSIWLGELGGPTDIVAEDEANARLIAAAPELLKVCQELEAIFNLHGPGCWGRLVPMVSAAIAKAEGREVTA